MKKKLLIFCPNIVVATNFFVLRNVFCDLMDSYELYLCCNTSVKKGNDLNVFEGKGFKGMYEWEASIKRNKIAEWQLHINTLGGKKYSRNGHIIYNMNKKSYGGIKKRIIHRILGTTAFTAKCTSNILELYAGEDKTIKNIVDQVKPDLIITFLCGSAPLEVESIKAGKINNIPVFAIQNAWDNISTRGLLPFMPDYMGVWGYQSRIFAEKMHNMPAERIVHLGFPYSDALREPCEKNDQTIRHELGLPDKKKVIFFPGGIWAFNEVRSLKKIDEAIEKGEFGDFCVFYRPHPFQHHVKNDLDFFEQEFKNVYLDPHMTESYRKAKKAKVAISSGRGKCSIDCEHMKEILKVSSFIVSTLSTVILHGAIMGVPSVSMLYTDEANMHFRGRYDFEELSIAKSWPGVFMCLKEKDLFSYCQKALAFSKDEYKRNLMKTYASNVVHGDAVSFSKRLLSAIEAIFNKNDVSCFHFLGDPVLSED